MILEYILKYSHEKFHVDYILQYLIGRQLVLQEECQHQWPFTPSLGVNQVVRLVVVDLPRKKRIAYALTHIFMELVLMLRKKTIPFFTTQIKQD